MKVLLGRAEIARRVAELGAQITRDYEGRGDLVLVGVLRGAVCFLADLMRAVELPTRVDMLGLRSYEGMTGSEARVTADLVDDVVGKHVLLVEDILERGTTVAAAFACLRERAPASVEVCVLLRKPEGLRTTVLAPVRYVGFDIGPEFVVGYGLDYEGRYRNLPEVVVLTEEELTAAGSGADHRRASGTEDTP